MQADIQTPILRRILECGIQDRRRIDAFYGITPAVIDSSSAESGTRRFARE